MPLPTRSLHAPDGLLAKSRLRREADRSMLPPVTPESDPSQPRHETLYRHLREQLASGALRPGQALSLRQLAEQLDASITPVRDAVWRLATERALDISPTRRIRVPVLGPRDIEELMHARALLEPEAAVRGLDAITPELVARLRVHDAGLNAALKGGDVEAYMAHNHGFHFTLYRAGRSDVLVPLIESLWVRFGPSMRHAFGDAVSRQGAAPGGADTGSTDTHARAIAAVVARDAAALAQAIRDDIGEGEAYLKHGLAARR
jgi:DNA-binding GntR family transcriptional regulator